jgi:hypothetical protein
MFVQSQSNVCKHEIIMNHLCLICLMSISWAFVWIIFKYGRATSRYTYRASDCLIWMIMISLKAISVILIYILRFI